MNTKRLYCSKFGLTSLLACWLSCFCGSVCLAGTNPSNADIRTMLVAAGKAHHIPPMILFAIAYQESGWRQFDASGNPVTNPNDGGIGIMQITGATAAPFNASRLANEIAYNIDAGATVLEGKWAGTPVIGDGNGMVGREKLENWYYAVWAYNSWGWVNNPNWTGQPKTNVPPYQELVYKWIGACPSALSGMWVNCTLSKPPNAQIGSVTVGSLAGCGQTIANTPAPVHIDADFDGVIDGGGGSDTDIWVDGGYSGAQTGTQTNPYLTVKAAVDRASATQAVTIHIKPGAYSEKIGTSKHIHFVTNGSGTVRIGG